MTQKTTVLGSAHIDSATFTRPANTTTYAAGDVVCNSTSAPTSMHFTAATEGEGAGRNDQAVINQAILVCSANQSLKPDLELWLFDTDVTMDNDNAAFTPSDAELATLVGIVEFPVANFKVGDATAGAGGNCVCVADNLGIPIKTLSGENTLYGVLVARNAYIPVSGESFTVRLAVLD